MDRREIFWTLMSIIGVMISLLGIAFEIQCIWNDLFVTPIYRYGFSYSSFTSPGPFQLLIGAIIWFVICFVILAVSAGFLGERIHDAYYWISEKLK